ncbi:MAG: HAMP domain-containing histidine kinase [Alphaproteobacteria bacterium]|nr:HAMP domain-containing histidine kinase [Alphaproteobacteria bacterium]
MSPSANLLRTSTFRLATAYLLLFVLSVGAILGYIYWNTAVLLERQTDETIRAEVRGLNEQYRFGRITALAKVVEQRSRRNSERGIYSIFDKSGRRLSGNLQGVPSGVSGTSGWLEFPYEVFDGNSIKQHSGRAFFTRLRGGYLLVVGRDVEERRQFASLIRRSVFIAIGMALVFGLGGGVLMSRNFLRRIDMISDTSKAIMAGGLSERMPVRGTNDEIDRLSGNLNNMLDQIERLMTGMREVSDNVAHDLKTPLTRLKARVEAALRQDTKGAYKEALVETISEADQLLATFNALLNIARAEAGQAREQMEPLDVSEVAEEIAELYQPLVEDADGTFEFSGTPGLSVVASRQLLAQAISNLIDNALKYAKPEEGDERPLEIALLVQQAKNKIEVTVADNGPGIPEADRARVLQRFVRLDTSRSQPGSGLGLSLVAGVARLHGGELVFRDGKVGFEASLVLPASAQAG